MVDHDHLDTAFGYRDRQHPLLLVVVVPDLYIAHSCTWRSYPRIPGGGYPVLGAPRRSGETGPTSALSAVGGRTALGSDAFLSPGNLPSRSNSAQSRHRFLEK